MRKIALLLLLLKSIASLSQVDHEKGFYVQGNAVTQLIQNPKVRSDGTFAYNSISTIGAGVYRTYTISEHLSTKLRISYTKKGFKDTKQFSHVTNHLDQVTTKNKFHFVSINKLLRYRLGHVYGLAGLSGDLLVSTNVAEEMDNPHSIEKIRREHFKKYLISGMAGFGVPVDEGISVELMFNYDLTPAYRQPDTVIRNAVWSLNLNFDIKELLNQRHDATF